MRFSVIGDGKAEGGGDFKLMKRPQGSWWKGGFQLDLSHLLSKLLL